MKTKQYKTFEKRCRVSEQCLSYAPFREMLTKLHDEMLQALAEQPAQHEPLIPFRHGCKWCGKTDGCEHQNPKIGCVNHDCDKCKALAEQPAQQEQDGCPICESDVHDRDALDKAEREIERLRSLVAKRTWVGLTDEEKRQLFDLKDYQSWLDYINAIETKLKEKNT